jgi:hypothetical protein
MGKPGRSFIKSSISTTSLLAACLCFSQAKAPTDQWAHLYDGSPLLVAEDKAWIVQEPRVISTGRVVALEFGPGPDEAVAVTVPRETITAEGALVQGQPGSGKPGGPSKINVVNLTSGLIKNTVSLPGTALTHSIAWVSKGRLLQVDCVTSEGLSEVVVDLIQGQLFRLPSNSGLMSVASEAPHLAFYYKSEAFSLPGEVKAAAPKPMDCLLIDFSQRPPSTRAITLPLEAGNPRALTSQGTLICAAGKGAYREVNLQNRSVRLLDEQRAAVLFDALLETQFRGDLDVDRWFEQSGYRLTAVKGGPRPSLPLSREADYAKLNSSGSKVLFIAHGAGFVVSLTPIDLAAAIKALLAQAKQRAMTNGKQAALAAIIYSADYDDVLPISGGQAKDALMPYLKDAGILGHVVWTNLTGQNMTGIKDPSQTELGYYPGPGGRAVIYADGHVVWKPDP